jgi:hypothetical protein
MGKHHLVRTGLLEPLAKLVGLLHGGDSADGLPVFFAFDEVSNLVVAGDQKVFLALKRVIRLLCNLPVWMFALSTQSTLERVSPSIADDPSFRVTRRMLDRVTPFYSFVLDMEATRLMSLNNLGLSLSLEQIGTTAHLVTFGRPLWLAYHKATTNVVRRAVTFKLLATHVYNPKDRNHVLAVLRSRICLDPCIQSKEAVALENEAIQSHLRWIVEFDFQSGYFRTATPSEPILSETAAWILMHGESAEKKGPTLWETTVKSLFSKLLSPGLIDRGRVGELVARLLCVLARDSILKSSPETETSPSLRYAKPFGVLDFLKTLFTKSNDLLTTPAQVGGNQTIKTCFQHASMNFTHWVTTSSFLLPETTSELLHNLLFGQAALQLASNQKHWDLLIPIYLGKAGEDFDRTQVTGMLIQVKNSKNKNKLDVEMEHYQHMFDLGLPMITLLVDLGVKKSRVERVPSFCEHIFAFRVSGVSMETYNCIASDAMEKTLTKILNHDLETGHGAQAIVTTFNDRFLSHDFKGRFFGKLAEVEEEEHQVIKSGEPARKRKKSQQKDAELPPLSKSEKGDSPARKRKRNGGKDVDQTTTKDQPGTKKKSHDKKEKGQHRRKKRQGQDDSSKKN